MAVSNSLLKMYTTCINYNTEIYITTVFLLPMWGEKEEGERGVEREGRKE